jgi:hypothetical protein
MYDELNTIKTWAWINAIPISRPEKAKINNKGIKPKIKYNAPLLIILKVNPDKIFKSMCPLKTFAPNLKPKDTFLDKYDINSISTNKGNSPNGHPDGTKNEKNFRECIWNPNIVAPITIVKLIEKVNIKWDVGAKLYGTIPTRLFTNININKDDINGKNIWPLFSFIWFTTMLYTVPYIVSNDKDQPFGVNLS